ncbi:SDR family NAD(P)-dependent oxidoreductase [Kaustia mangrovi]|uniref:SDR family NAD(P)-dependent oxidoreductase n=1 Tax=Kaustia mangrovi TaxID=2593653 RepID=A0A7S8C7A6_9HYPH|nr:SDR family NAD(P)-dependent oxidoreductase [Kaustia mangrovi]QPC44720.1 SDR family NAD(P)-dependent oxidoreductase [Kaustia mangrovi]
MSRQTPQTGLIVGAGAGLSASLARAFAREDIKTALAARNPDDLADLCAETGARAFSCDASRADEVEALFAALDGGFGLPDVVVYNPSRRLRGAVVDLDPAEVEEALRITAFGGFLVARQAARCMLEKGGGTIMFTGASASVKGYAQSAPFAMGKFALRGLAQSLARELHPRNIHVAHIVIDGSIRNPGRQEPDDAPDSMLSPDAIAEAYVALLKQDRSAWSWEIELRPWVERF